MSDGVLITFEGGEGAGKSTQLKLLKRFLDDTSIDLIVTREPGGVPSAENIRDLLVNGQTDKWDSLTETLLHFAARQEHVSKLIEPALKAGKWVLCDRFADSTTAYQGFAQNIDLDLISNLYNLIIGDLQPNLTIILDLPAEVGLERAKERGLAQSISTDPEILSGCDLVILALPLAKLLNPDKSLLKCFFAAAAKVSYVPCNIPCVPI